MPTTIKLKNSVTTTAAPTTLVQGEAAVNVTDKKVWVGNAASSPVQILGAGASLDGMPIGATTASTGAFTTLSASGTSTFSANQVISVTDNSNAALRITQLGTGDALLVEDSANPDSSPFVINALGQVIQGYTETATSAANLQNNIQVHGVSSVNSPDIGIFSWSSTAARAPFLNFYTSKSNTLGTRAAVSLGNTLATISFRGAVDASTWATGASIVSVVESSGTVSSTSLPSRLAFNTTADGAATPTERMRINSSGNVLIGKTSATANGGDLQVSSGITFPATQVAKSDANTLDDYEEGGWNGTVSDNLGNNATMSTNGGSYTKVGNLVTVTGYFACSSKGSLSGALRITGLPFTVFNGTAAYAGQALGYTNGANITAGQNIGVYAEYNTTYLNLTYWSSSIGTVGLPATAINNNFDFILSLTYRTN